jgi:hypothetical protein
LKQREVDLKTKESQTLSWWWYLVLNEQEENRDEFAVALVAVAVCLVECALNCRVLKFVFPSPLPAESRLNFR